MVLMGVYITSMYELLRQHETLVRRLSLRGANMIDLRNTCVLVRTEKENEMLLKEAEKQGFHWYLKGGCKPLLEQCFPDVLRFYNDKDIVYDVCINPDFTFYEASELLGTKEITAREFIERIADISDCCGRECIECVLDETNTKCDKTLCNTCNWKDNIDELLEIVKSRRFTISTTEEKAIEDIEKFIKNPDCLVVVNNEFVDALKLAVKKLKGEK